ncbi:hypothetical protein FRB91_001491 [Serendipita sp. 411]|nr:hypothetical protein FRC15_001632 [Serendipita sp. 397]KAG8800429.1 hypothetical protein FRC16_002910 [Serendipita sp. 398]KAG8838073.1 hypothetical protein FRC20_006511 [Serendipita sp. 405]KAG8845775.1 hypothetical protein FRB91_001491 [Serendipita sp. 411]
MSATLLFLEYLSDRNTSTRGSSCTSVDFTHQEKRQHRPDSMSSTKSSLKSLFSFKPTGEKPLPKIYVPPQANLKSILKQADKDRNASSETLVSDTDTTRS